MEVPRSNPPSSPPPPCFCALVTMTKLTLLFCSLHMCTDIDLKLGEKGDSAEYSLVSFMSQVITSAIAQNSSTIAEAVSKEALIPANIMDKILKVDYTPLQRAEILFKALMEEIKKDAKVFHKFLALVSNLGLNRPLIITLKDILPVFSE